MRTIKFRAYDKKEKKWLHGYEELGGCSIVGEVVILGEWMCGVKLEDLKNIKVMQYTGLKDKNGAEIYEGDLMRFDLGDREAELGGEENRYCYCEVKFMGGAFCSYEDGYIDYLSDGSKEVLDWEVIGNIYENPDLISSKE